MSDYSVFLLSIRPGRAWQDLAGPGRGWRDVPARQCSARVGRQAGQTAHTRGDSSHLTPHTSLCSRTRSGQVRSGRVIMEELYCSIQVSGQ